MDTDQFDSLSRAVGSRRGILAGALAGVTLLGLGHAVDAKRRRRKHKKICKKKKIRVSCVDSCRFFNISNCHKFDVRCKCPRGKSCLANDSCGLSCAAADCPEGSGCTCSTSEPKVCLAPFTTCEDVPTTCATTADCRFRFFCDETSCGEGGASEKRCRPLCGNTCLANMACGIGCASTDCPAESGCTCSTSEPKVCLEPFTSCDDVPTTCATAADCPGHFTCDEVPCGAGGASEKRCVSMCLYFPRHEQTSSRTPQEASYGR